MFCIIKKMKDVRKKRQALEKEVVKAENGETYTSQVREERRCVQGTTLPSVQAADHFRSMLLGQPAVLNTREQHTLQCGITVSSILFPFRQQKDMSL